MLQTFFGVPIDSTQHEALKEDAVESHQTRIAHGFNMDNSDQNEVIVHQGAPPSGTQLHIGGNPFTVNSNTDIAGMVSDHKVIE